MSVQLLIGYARLSTTGQDLAAQQAGLESLGVDQERGSSIFSGVCPFMPLIAAVG